MKSYQVYWSPEGRPIAIVQASNEAAAIRKAPRPYRHYLGELYAIELTPSEAAERNGQPRHLDRNNEPPRGRR